jgi:hypothetical protein
MTFATLDELAVDCAETPAASETAEAPAVSSKTVPRRVAAPDGEVGPPQLARPRPKAAARNAMEIDRPMTPWLASQIGYSRWIGRGRV